MSAATTNDPEVNDSLLRWFVKDAVPSPDFLLGAAATLGSWIVLAASSKIEQSEAPERLLYGFVGVGVAVISVCLTSVSILVGGLGERYLQVLRHAGGLELALRPIKAVSVLGAATATASIVSALVWEGGRLLRPGLFAIPFGLTVWTFVGAVQNVFMIAFQGVQRNKLNQAVAETERRLKAVTEQRNSG